MINETRVNLRHLLEDIRDSYALPIEEVIVTELVANALDSHASKVDFLTDEASGALTCIDNGAGMKRPELREYHNIAATTKERGHGIGFAGVGAKLSLLIADAVITETRGGRGSRAATEWHLTSDLRAPWKFIPSPNLVTAPRGTAVRIVLSKQGSPLLSPDFLRVALRKHFNPLLNEEVWKNILRFIYKRGVQFFVNGDLLARSDGPAFQAEAGKNFKKSFFVYLGSRNRRPVGYGYIVKSDTIEAPQNKDVLFYQGEGSPPTNGMILSTYGKIVKRGWEWLGLLPKSWESTSGLIEIPGLAEILTTNKTDFLNDSASLKKYYRFRKAIQEAVHPILRELGVDKQVETADKSIKPLQREIENVLQTLIADFPELQPLVHFYRRQGILTEAQARERKIKAAGREEHLVGVSIEKLEAAEIAAKTMEEKIQASQAPEGLQKGREQGARKDPGLKISFEENASPNTLGRLAQNTIFVNALHPAWRKAKEEGLEQYHILHTIAWVLSGFIEPDHAPQEFVSRFLFAWGRGDQATLQLFNH